MVNTYDCLNVVYFSQLCCCCCCCCCCCIGSTVNSRLIEDIENESDNLSAKEVTLSCGGGDGRGGGGSGVGGDSGGGGGGGGDGGGCRGGRGDGWKIRTTDRLKFQFLSVLEPFYAIFPKKFPDF